jgi:hypothetical protein
MKQDQDNDLHRYKLFGLPLITFMLLLALGGILLTLLLRYYFPQLG